MIKTITSLKWGFVLFFMYTNSGYTEPPTQAEDCSSQVARIESLTQQFHRLNFKIQQQRDQGIDRDAEAIKLIESFYPQKAPAKCRIALWKAVVALAIAQAPFDMESQGATLLALRLLQNQDLNPSYKSSLRQSSDHCRMKLISSVVQEKVCQYKTNPNRAHDPEENPACQTTFSYEECIGFKFQ